MPLVLKHKDIKTDSPLHLTAKVLLSDLVLKGGGKANARIPENQEEKMDALKMIAQDSLKEAAPQFNVGDTVKVHVRIAEGDKFRIQIFEGTVIAKKHGGISETFTVRRVVHGCGVERVFPLHSPTVEKVEIVREGKVRRAKLYYLRDRVGKAAKVKSKI